MGIRAIGRPLKYGELLGALEDDDLYTPASIASLAVEKGLLPGIDAEKLERQRIRIALGRYCNNHRFPDEGDGMVTLPGQSPTPGWFGWRWKEGMNP